MADEIAEPRLDMYIRVAAFTVTKMFYNTTHGFLQNEI